ncbi:MAG: DUF3365 domain-containing protein [Planctomycetes bacterium]|nr:DUF3365 domain-containing protein [Planctomycetota bacterium]MBL7008009.1 DUF3365 domain-containing protein [Planctomycetota bacterium]
MKGRTLLLLGAWLAFVVLGTTYVMKAVGKRAAMFKQVTEGEARAAEAVGRLQASLKARLTEAMQSGGPAAAIEVCAEAAQPLTEELRGDAGFFVGRTALRLRNPSNAPDDFVLEWMAKAASRSSAAAPLEAATKVEEFIDGDRLLHFWQPIYLGAQCLACHGSAEQIPAEVRALLADEYPDDRATGFAEGDFRGVFVARVPLPKIGG